MPFNLRAIAAFLLARPVAVAAYSLAGIAACALAEWQAMAYWFDRGDWSRPALAVILALIAGVSAWGSGLELLANRHWAAIWWTFAAIAALAVEFGVQIWMERLAAAATYTAGPKTWLWEIRDGHAIMFMFWTLGAAVLFFLATVPVFWQIHAEERTAPPFYPSPATDRVRVLSTSPHGSVLAARLLELLTAGIEPDEAPGGRHRFIAPGAVEAGLYARDQTD